MYKTYIERALLHGRSEVGTSVYLISSCAMLRVWTSWSTQIILREHTVYRQHMVMVILKVHLSSIQSSMDGGLPLDNRACKGSQMSSNEIWSQHPGQYGVLLKSGFYHLWWFMITVAGLHFVLLSCVQVLSPYLEITPDIEAKDWSHVRMFPFCYTCLIPI